MAALADAHMDNCCGCELTYANLMAVFNPYGYVGFSNPDGPCVGDDFCNHRYLTSEITASDSFGNTFDQVVSYGRHNGALLSGTLRTNSAGTMDFNVITSGFDLLDCADDFLLWGISGSPSDFFRLQLSDLYTAADLKVDIDALYAEKTLDDVAGGDVLHLTWDRDASWGLPGETYPVGSPNLEWDRYDGRTLSADAEVLVQVLDHPGSVDLRALADRGGVAGATLRGLIVRGLGSTQHCYEEYEVTPPNLTCAEIDADVSHIVRLQPDEVDMGNEAVCDVERYREFKLHSLPSSGSPGCSCVPL